MSDVPKEIVADIFVRLWAGVVELVVIKGLKNATKRYKNPYQIKIFRLEKFKTRHKTKGGRVEITIAGGRVAWENGELKVVPSSGKYIEMRSFSYLFDGFDKADANYLSSLQAPSVNGPTIIGSCNGLLCLTNTDEYIFLLNPTTSKYWKSAVCRIPLGVKYIVFGFGYGDAKDDYKVVRMVQFYGKDKESFRAEVSVYSLKSNSWRRIGDFPYYLSYKRVSGVLASGALQWVVS
ncbi:hypothetical protein LguiA_013155 [Lonicera macranthoides]